VDNSEASTPCQRLINSTALIGLFPLGAGEEAMVIGCFYWNDNLNHILKDAKK
jgi:hypothetical protein